MRDIFKPYRLVLYFLALVVFFFFGIIYAGLIDAGKNQGLAAAAIVLGYGLVSSIIGLLIAGFASKRVNPKTIVTINKVLFLLTLGFLSYFTWKYQSNKSAKPHSTFKDDQLVPKPTETPTN